MKLDRLLAILTLLLQRERVTAPELAKKLEVSKRTIHRDIDCLCQAGIPVITCQGGNGGICLAEGFKLNNSFLTGNELQSILAGLKGLQSVSEASKIEKLISKLSLQKEAAVARQDPIIIDLASHYRGSLSQKIELLKTAINQNHLLTFDYYSEKGKTRRLVEPINISFRWSSWYLFGFCRERQDFRLFKLNRLWEPVMLDETFTVRDIPPDKLEPGRHLTDDKQLTLIVDREIEYRIVDEYGPGSYEVLEDGQLMVKVGFTNWEGTISWVMSLGDKARVIQPPDLAYEIQKRVKNMATLYEQDIMLSSS
jgi:predicted DNA-binding transcriptional regulator YafY